MLLQPILKLFLPVNRDKREWKSASVILSFASTCFFPGVNFISTNENCPRANKSNDAVSYVDPRL